MWIYIVRRTFQSIVVLLLVSLLCFTLMHMMPGNPWTFVGMKLADHIYAEEQIRLHSLDQPIYIQYILWLKGLSTGYLGQDYNGNAIDQYIWSYVKNSLILVGTAWLLSIMIAVPWGIYNSRKPYGLSDRTALLLSLTGLCIPGFVLGYLLQQIFAMDLFNMDLLWLPPSGMHTPSKEGEVGDLLIHMILPVLTLTIGNLAYYLRFVRNNMIEVLPSEFLLTARAKGASEKRIIYRHAFKNAAIPMVTMLAMDIPVMVGGSAVIENVFNWQGIGLLLVWTAQNRDLPVLLAIIMIVSLVVIIANWIADILYTWIDPRVRLTRSSR
ncbi:ABC transporter permease [Paenibacillus sp. J22TS3]|uniref:ABC transporter permease n=1 Tax=Paenibacillus sp. J22TS3 TaxID=2807192 RepID=UPI001BD0A3F7|nr:ABC transporter permease [Paenibacillus sp. J22TS3]